MPSQFTSAGAFWACWFDRLVLRFEAVEVRLVPAELRLVPAELRLAAAELRLFGVDRACCWLWRLIGALLRPKTPSSNPRDWDWPMFLWL